MFQSSESSSSSVPGRSSLQSIGTSPADESDTRLITQMDSVTDISGFSAAHGELYQRRVVIQTTLDGCVCTILSCVISHSIIQWLIISHI